MNNADKLVLVLICFSMLIVTANSAVQETLVGKEIFNLGNDNNGKTGELFAETIALENQNNEQPETQLVFIDDYMTPNGMIITIGKILNYEGVEKTETVSIPVGKKTLDFDVSIAPYSIWTYAKLDDMLIVPKQTAIINRSETAYYPSGEELVIKIHSEDLHELQIYTGSKGVPSIIIPKMSINWRYDSDKKIVTMESRNIIKDEIVMFWVGFSGDDGTIFLEDRQKIETLNHRIETMAEEGIHLNDDVTIGEEKLDKLETKIDELDLRIEIASKERDEIESSLMESNITVTKLENIITANVMVSPSITIIWALFAIILVILLIDVFFFKSKRSAKK